MSRKSLRPVTAIVLAISFLAYSQLVLSAEVTGRLLGAAVGSQDAAIKTSLGTWVPIAGKTYPVVDGAGLKTQTGVLLIAMKDSTKINVGKKSSLTIHGKSGQYSVKLDSGGIVFVLPESAGFTIATRTASVRVQATKGTVQKVRVNSQNDRVGVVVFDGTGTRVSSINGDFMVVNATGLTNHALSKGSAVYVAGVEEGFAVKKVQLAEEDKDDAAAATGGVVAGGAAAGGAAAAGGLSTGAVLGMVAGGAALAAGGIAAANSSGGGGSTLVPASPSTP